MNTVLFLNQNFYHYDMEIKKRIEKMGYAVIGYSLLPKVAAIWKLLGLTKSARLRAMSIQQQKMIEDLRNRNLKPIAIFVLAGNDLLPETCEVLKELYPDAVFIWYMWDDTSNIMFFEEKAKYFEHIISFDKVEAEERKLDFIPLFYMSTFDDKCDHLKYDISIIGSNHGDRYEIVRRVIDSGNYGEIYAYLCSGRLLYLKFMKKYGKKALDVIGINPLPYTEVINVMKSSKCILDIQNDRQTGLTMRTIEALGLKKKIITTNETIRLYDFYDENNVSIIDRNGRGMPGMDFVDMPFKEVDNNVIESYSLDRWCIRIMNYVK